MKQLKNKPFLLYTLISLILLIIIAIPLLIRGGLFVDAISQHLLFMNDYIEEIKNLINGNGFTLFRFDMGLGSDVIISYTYYSLFDPLNIIALILPISMIEASYYIILILRLYLSGIFIMLLAKKLNVKDNLALVTLGIFYCYNVCTIYSALRHPIFLNVLMLLPLLCIAFESIMNKKTPYMLIILTCYGLISQFYFFAFLTLGFELYITLRIFSLDISKNKKIKKFIYINLYYLIGIVISSFVLLPQVITLFDSSRTSTKGFVMYNAKYYLGLISSLMIPFVNTHYTATIGNFMVFLITIYYIFNNYKKPFSLYTIICFIFLSFSIFGYLFNIGSYVNNRWSFIMLLPIALIIGETINDNKINNNILEKMAKFIVALFLLIGMLALCLLINLIKIDILKALFYIVLILLYLYVVTYIIKNKRFSKIVKFLEWIFNKKRMIYFTLALSTLSAIIITVFSTSLFYTKASFSIYEESEMKEAFDEDNSFFRVEQSAYSLGRKSLANDGIYYHYSSTAFYNTMATSSITDMLNYYNIPNFNYGTGYNGFNDRIIINALSSTKYLLISEEETKTIPLGYEYLKTINTPKIYNNNYYIGGEVKYIGDKIEEEETKIYVNNNFVNFGYVYHEYYTLEDLNSLNGLEREYLSLYGVILEEENKYLKHQTVFPHELNITSYDIDENYFNNNDAYFINLNHNSGNIYLNIENLEAEEEYIIDFEVYKDGILLSRASEKYYPYGSLFYYNNLSFSNLGTFDSGNYVIKIIPSIENVNFKKITIYENDLSSISSQITNLNKETLEQLSFNDKGFKANIKTTGGMLLVSIPYSNGFKAYVDGEETEILKANIGYMGIMLNSGYHNIEFKYFTKGLKTGVSITLVSLSLLLLSIPCVIIYKKRIKREKNDD